MSQQKQKQHWGYSKPDEWVKHYPVGSHQSPINILVANYDQLVQSTCCSQKHGSNNNNNNNNSTNGNQKQQHHHHHHHNHIISERMASLYLSATNKHKGQVIEQQQQQGRKHLDSIGLDEQHPRSSSTCSSNASGVFSASGSSSPARWSPAQQLNYGDDSDYYDSPSPIAINHHQQPTEVDSSSLKNGDCQKTRYCTSNHKIFLGYPRYLSSIQICNTGHSWQVNFPPELANHTLISGPPFGDREYRLAQLHCHWGENCDNGSEHLINGSGFAAEIHFVHWNCTHFSSMEEAAKHKHGLAVLGVMVEALEGEQHRNKHLDKIANALKKIEKPGSSAEVLARLDLKKLFPANRWTYASYEGSLTTPPLSEVVDWVVFLNPIQCSTEQIEQFRHLRCPSGEIEGGEQKLIKNHRPVQPQNDRVVSIWTHH